MTAILLTIYESVSRPFFVRASSVRIPGNTLLGEMPLPPGDGPKWKNAAR